MISTISYIYITSLKPFACIQSLILYLLKSVIIIRSDTRMPFMDSNEYVYGKMIFFKIDIIFIYFV